MPLLARFTENPLSPRLIDYEQLVGEDGKRTVAFGFYAGSAGVVEGLHASALDLLEIGIASPFLVRMCIYALPTLPSRKYQECLSLPCLGDVEFACVHVL